jgi:hypothetical protein
MKRFWLSAAAALILAAMLPDGAFAQRGGFRGGGFGGGGFRGAAIGGGFQVPLLAVASEVLGVASKVPLSAQAFVAPSSVQAFVAQPSVQGSALARLGHASAPPRSRQAFGAEALALGIRS